MTRIFLRSFQAVCYSLIFVMWFRNLCFFKDTVYLLCLQNQNNNTQTKKNKPVLKSYHYDFKIIAFYWFYRSVMKDNDESHSEDDTGHTIAISVHASSLSLQDLECCSLIGTVHFLFVSLLEKNIALSTMT